MTPQALLAEIQSGPLAAELAPHVAAGDDNAAAALLSDPARGTPGPVPVPYAEFVLFAAAAGLRTKLEAGAQTADPPAGLCKTFLELTVSPHVSVFDPANGLPLLATLRDLGVLTPTDYATVAAYVTRPCSRAHNLGAPGGRVSAADVAAAFGRV